MPRNDIEKLLDLLEAFEKMTVSMMQMGDDIEKIYATLIAYYLRQNDHSR